jgi:hypothetical protein
MGGRSSNGLYGIFHPEPGVTVLAHRWINELISGPIPLGTNVCHACDNGLCENPGHHWRGSQAENVWDCRAKNRHDRKLEPNQVLEARRDRAELGLPFTVLSARYGVAPSTIRQAISGRSWGHL